MKFKKMPLTVILDGSGNDLYQSGPATYLGWIADHKKKPPNIDL